MAIFKNITESAVNQIKILAEIGQIPLDKLYVQIDNKPIGPWKNFWIITLTTNFNDKKYYLEQLSDLRVIIDKDSSIFLVGATFDYDAILLKKPFFEEIATIIDPDRPVYPKGFLFSNQNLFPQSQFV